MTTRKRFKVAKFHGEQYAVIDTVKNATVAVEPSKQAAREAADQLNARRSK